MNEVGAGLLLQQSADEILDFGAMLGYLEDAFYLGLNHPLETAYLLVHSDQGGIVGDFPFFQVKTVTFLFLSQLDHPVLLPESVDGSEQLQHPVDLCLQLRGSLEVDSPLIYALSAYSVGDGAFSEDP